MISEASRDRLSWVSLVLLVGAVVTVLALLRAVGGGVLSAAQTARKLQRIVAPHSRVHCVGTSGGWNYSCRITPPHHKTMTTIVMVDAHKIVDIGG